MAKILKRICDGGFIAKLEELKGKEGEITYRRVEMVTVASMALRFSAEEADRIANKDFNGRPFNETGYNAAHRIPVYEIIEVKE